MLLPGNSFNLNQLCSVHTAGSCAMKMTESKILFFPKYIIDVKAYATIIYMYIYTYVVRLKCVVQNHIVSIYII